MNQFDISSKEYDLLYARFLKRSPQDLIKYAGNIENKSVLDLCGGSGRLSKELLKNGPKNVDLVDLSLEMMAPVLNYPKINSFNKSIEEFVKCRRANSYAAIFCQQAINYWFNEDSLKDIYRILEFGGKFIFNTFKNKPGIFPIPHVYILDRKRYLELSFSLKDLIYHIQIVEGLPPHINNFKWISSKKFESILESAGFNLRSHCFLKSIVYECWKD